ncbi:MAG: DsbA family oxidoreductase [Methanomethylophilus sp.]|jgi:predicted DsbA family dithiol-disulfide isomerase
MLIEYWSDYTCPFCYIAETRLKKAIAQMNLGDRVKLVFKAFELYQEAPQWAERNIVEGMQHTYGMSEADALAKVNRIEGMAQGEGLDFHYGTAHTCNTFDALRIAKYAQTLSDEKLEKYSDLMFDSFFGKNERISDHAVILRNAVAAGMKEADVKGILEGDKFAKEVRRDEQEGYMLGVRAVPFFAVARKYSIPGCIETEQFKQVIAQAIAEEDAMDPESMKGISCGPDGCH